MYGVTFVQGVVLARLLDPSDFGLTAMLGIFLGVGGILAESGLGTALVVAEQEHLNGRTEGRVVKWNLSVGIGLYLVLVASSPFIATWYEKPILAPLMMVMALGVVINAGSVVLIARLTRAKAFDRLAWVNTGSTVMGAALAICLAGYGCGVWSIAGMGLVTAAIRLVSSWWFARDCKVRRQEERGTQPKDGFGDLLSYGIKLMVSGLVHVVYTESYNIVIGKMWSPAAVGLFSRGHRWAKLPGEVVNESVGRVALPSFAQGNAQSYRLFGFMNGLLLWPVLVILWIWAEEIVGVVLGAHWLDCVPYMRILLVGQAFSPVGNISLQAIRASGHSKMILKTDAWKRPLGIVALLVGIPFGIVGLCWAKVVSDVVEAVVDVIYAFKACRIDANLAYRTKANLRPYLWRFELLTRRPRISPTTHADTWCHYLIGLLECGLTRRLERVLARYLDRGGSLAWFANYFRLAELAVVRGCTETEVVRTADVWRSLSAQRATGGLSAFVRGKTVAVVGNGPQEVGKGLGHEIDGHDVVIRINNYVLQGYEADYGTRTDVWVKNVTPEMRHTKPSPEIRLVVYNANWDRDQLELGYRDRIADDLNDKSVAVDFIDIASRKELTEALGSIPTTGALIIAALRTYDCRSVDVYGCSYVEGACQGAYRRLPKDVSEEKVAEQVAWHRFDREVTYLAKQFDGRRLRV